MKIKICGIRRAEDITAAVQAGADAIGLNFVRSSARFVNLPLARKLILQSKAPKMTWCGVFVNATQDEILEAVKTLDLTVVQLHGDEKSEFLNSLRTKLGSRVSIWKAVRVAQKEDLQAMTQCDPDAWLIDSKVAGMRGGSGQTFDWSVLTGISRSKPLILSGGLNPGNVAEAIRCVAPEWVDVASGVESGPGIKDEKLIQEFVRAAKTPRQI
jgi:phosphoribosylanthranilate isomerase